MIFPVPFLDNLETNLRVMQSGLIRQLQTKKSIKSYHRDFLPNFSVIGSNPNIASLLTAGIGC